MFELKRATYSSTWTGQLLSSFAIGFSQNFFIGITSTFVPKSLTDALLQTAKSPEYWGGFVSVNENEDDGADDDDDYNNYHNNNNYNNLKKGHLIGNLLVEIFFVHNHFENVHAFSEYFRTLVQHLNRNKDEWLKAIDEGKFTGAVSDPSILTCISETLPMGL